MRTFATLEDVEALWRRLSSDERPRAEELLRVVSDSLRTEARKVGKDLDDLACDEAFQSVLRSVVVDVVARTLMTATDQEPMSQFSESALGYSFQGTFLVPGGGLFIKNSELARLGLRSQKYGVVNFYGYED